MAPTVMSDVDGVKVTNGIATKVAVNNVDNTIPTLAEATTSFGDPATKPAGFMGVINDAAGGTNCFLVLGDGTNFFALKFTKLT